MALLEVTGISKNFGSTHVLQNISLNLEKGEALALSLIHISEPTRP